MPSGDRDPAGRESAAQAAPLDVNVREYDTKTLFMGDREIVIHHAGSAYRMKITKQGKLILNK
ncbi:MULTISPECIES: hemin uptake protein HemP [unclassified Rhizobium]|uniref:hemin uptake protein HemP n=1 Tax=unclassified Rhizobium TaxID=2613769 RepID=UPI001602A318|nr:MULTISPECIES: hemin uptake protein HemP [unclassified Rhizobium]MBB1248927.1 hemin uptake protein HemP [Rhizobium sp. G21]MCV3766855.1 hemin uptake protein HemP [Rhizobium sp. TRM95796]